MKELDYKFLSEGDKILVYMDKDATSQQCLDIWKNLQKSFPKNRVIIIHNRFITGIEILKERTEYEEIVNSFLEDIKV